LLLKMYRNASGAEVDAVWGDGDPSLGKVLK